MIATAVVGTVAIGGIVSFVRRILLGVLIIGSVVPLRVSMPMLACSSPICAGPGALGAFPWSQYCSTDLVVDDYGWAECADDRGDVHSRALADGPMVGHRPSTMNPHTHIEHCASAAVNIGHGASIYLGRPAESIYSKE